MMRQSAAPHAGKSHQEPLPYTGAEIGVAGKGGPHQESLTTASACPVTQVGLTLMRSL